jgi:hypothetical protein
MLLPGPVVAIWSGTFGLGAPSPTPRTRMPSTRLGASRRVPPVPVDPFRGNGVALGELPNTVVARAAVPDAGARPSSTSPSLPGACATILWSRSSTPTVTTG